MATAPPLGMQWQRAERAAPDWARLGSSRDVINIPVLITGTRPAPLDFPIRSNWPLWGRKSHLLLQMAKLPSPTRSGPNILNSNHAPYPGV